MSETTDVETIENLRRAVELKQRAIWDLQEQITVLGSEQNARVKEIASLKVDKEQLSSLVATIKPLKAENKILQAKVPHRGNDLVSKGFATYNRIVKELRAENGQLKMKLAEKGVHDG